MSQTKPRLQSTTYEFPIRGPEKKKSLQQLIYDSENGHILGRTAKSWVQLLVFYTIFYTILAALFSICMQGLFLSLDDHEPTWQLHESIIGTNPGVGFRPLPDDPEAEAIIRYDAKNQTQVAMWTRRLDEFLESYRNKTKLPGGGNNQIICDYDHPPADHQVCAVELDSFGPCTQNEGYSYNKSSPCIFLKLNRIYKWVPEYYSDPNDLPAEMPESLKTNIRNTPADKREQIWVSCDGHKAPDRELLNGQLEYYPSQGFPGYYYPYKNTRGYLSPLVAVRLLRPATSQIINIECRLWAKNIRFQGGRERSGSALVEVMID
jgi:sodium/potassium-transporting ATPase subunit beta